MKLALLLVVACMTVSSACGTSTTSEPEAGTSVQSQQSPPSAFKTNDVGQTFGTYRRGGTRPDFVPGATDEGVAGYFLTDDWVPEMDANGNPVIPSDAPPVVPDSRGDVKINVYAFDGTTVLGQATIAHVSQE